MSRSRKKVAGFKDRNPYMKKYANRVVRRRNRTSTIPSGNFYRKLWCSYDICDYKFLYFNERQIWDYVDFRVKLNMPSRGESPEKHYHRAVSK